MKNTLNQLALHAQKIDRRHIQFVLVLLGLVMLVLGAGAPEDGGNTGL
jgi:hypothetical protein